ncbi:hypothetical protein B0A49_04213 [Cryomyces minteri]|uniref:UCH37-like C-terminal domain-containing protein n=1 Tax=Cryomyces minteri TaxID=331657 RepID=A0A4U0XIM3_9PEZI|nr:hypothetical protein B0A49_04213 [Cryomyces minteri]
MVGDLRVRASEAGDTEALLAEERKRTGWQWENALRRHNFVGFVGELLRGVVKAKIAEGEGEYERWVGEAKERTRRRAEERRKKGGAAEEMDA